MPDQKKVLRVYEDKKLHCYIGWTCSLLGDIQKYTIKKIGVCKRLGGRWKGGAFGEWEIFVIPSTIKNTFINEKKRDLIKNYSHSSPTDSQDAKAMNFLKKCKDIFLEVVSPETANTLKPTLLNKVQMEQQGFPKRKHGEPKEQCVQRIM